MRVRAKRMGYYEHKRIKPGQEFVLVTRKGLDQNRKPLTLTPEKQFTETWMEKVEGSVEDRSEQVVAKAKGKTGKAVKEPEPVESDVI